MEAYIGEVIGTMILILLGDGVVANVLLGKTKGNNSGWIVITTAWALAVFVGAYATAAVSGAHLNPAVYRRSGRRRLLLTGACCPVTSSPK
jgi:glycerol uptake facilitator protein